MKNKKHRHKYEENYCDCPNCEFGVHYNCECGATKDGEKGEIWKPIYNLKRKK